MSSIITLAELLLIFSLTFVMGLPFTKMLLPRDIEKDFGIYITPTVGYLVFCLLAFTASGTFKWPVVATCWGSMLTLLVAGCATQLRSAWRISVPVMGAQIKHILLLVLPMALVILLPLFYFGAKTYLGAVNPDFFAGVVDNYYLLHGHSVADFIPGTDSYFPVDYMAGSVSASARFGAGIFAILIQLISGEGTPTALSLIVGFFLLNVPLVVYFFSSTVLGFNKQQATLAGCLMGISAPTGMSHLYYYLGQNSGLPALPLVAATGYLMLTRPSVKTLALCAILANALFVNYFAMLPYALAPAGVLGLYLLLSRRLSIMQGLGLLFGFLGLFVLLHLGNCDSMIVSMRAWGNVIGQTLQGQFFLEFLTEIFVPIVFGIVVYPLNSSWISLSLGIVKATRIVYFVTVVVLGFWTWSIAKWLRNTREIERKIFVLASILIYLSVWWFYTFYRQYAYAVFKMSSWLQFIIVPFMAYGLYWLHKRIKENKWSIIGYSVGIVYVLLNLVSSIQYGYDGFGRNTASGYIVNNFEMSGNLDYVELPEAVAKVVKPNESIAVLFVDSIQNYWVSYHLRRFRQSIPFHENMPGDDENLPDIETDTVMDYYGDIRKVSDPLAHDYNDDYLLTWNKDHLNQDIVNPNYSGSPVWEDHTFRLYDAHKQYDVLTTGRGFYRLEYITPSMRYWMPKTIRWSAQGGEFYLLRVKSPGQPYRLAFDVIVGYEAPSDSRTLELWLNGKKIQTMVATHSARIITPPFYPRKGMNKLVVYVKDKNHTIARQITLWNNDVPADYRRLNVLFANAYVLSPNKTMKYNVVPLDKALSFLQLFDYAKQFNGLQLDGWIGEAASLVFAVPTSVHQVELKGFVPGVFKFPYHVNVKINGVVVNSVISQPGEFTLTFSVPKRANEITMELQPSQSVEAGNANVRHKVIRQSMKIESIRFT